MPATTPHPLPLCARTGGEPLEALVVATGGHLEPPCTLHQLSTAQAQWDQSSLHARDSTHLTTDPPTACTSPHLLGGM